MQLSKFILLFVIGCIIYQFANNSLLGPEVRLFPHNGQIYPGMDSTIIWKKLIATIIYPITLVLIAPLSGLTKLPDAPPPMILLAFALYWTAIAVVIYFLFYKLIRKKK